MTTMAYKAGMRSLVALVLLAIGCGPAPPPPPLPAPTAAPVLAPAPVASASAPEAVDEVAAYAKEILAQAAAAEPLVTPKLVAIAKEMGGEMYKLEFRLKTQASTERKLRAKMASKGLTLREVIIDDGLRYTMRCDDEPPGRYLEAVKAVLRELGAMGHEVEELKNYWPKDDNYSGINGVLRAPSGLLWELQFHTSASLMVQAETRSHYEELRKTETSIERKRELFDQMTAAWQKVPIPKGLLEAGALHPKAELMHRPRP